MTEPRNIVRMAVSTIILFLSIGMAWTGIYLCFLQLSLPTDKKSVSKLKFGETIEVSSDIVGILVMVVSLLFFWTAGRWFFLATGPTDEDLLVFLRKGSIGRSGQGEIMKYLTKDR